MSNLQAAHFFMPTGCFYELFGSCDSNVLGGVSASSRNWVVSSQLTLAMESEASALQLNLYWQRRGVGLQGPVCLSWINILRRVRGIVFVDTQSWLKDSTGSSGSCHKAWLICSCHGTRPGPGQCWAFGGSTNAGLSEELKAVCSIDSINIRSLAAKTYFWATVTSLYLPCHFNDIL